MRCNECGRWMTALDFSSSVCNQCNEIINEEE